MAEVAAPHPRRAPRGAPRRASSELELPAFRGTTGLGVHADRQARPRRLPGRAGRRRSSPASTLGRAARAARGRHRCSRWPRPPRSTPSSSSATSAPSSPTTTPLVARNEAAVDRRRVRLRPARRRRRRADRRRHRPRAGRHARCTGALLVVARGGRRRPRSGSSRSSAGDGLVNGVVELVVGQNARLRFVDAQDLDETTWVFGTQRAVVGRDGRLDWITLGFGSANGKVFQETKLAGPGAARQRHRRLRARAAASTSTSTRCRSTPRRDTTQRPRLPRASSPAARARSGAG